MNDADFYAAMSAFGPLASLSIQHCPRGTTPAAPTNDDRARAFRDAQPVTTHNAHPWPHLER